MSAWIRICSDSEGGSELHEAMRLAQTPHGTVDNVMRVHSLRPSTMKGHVLLYRAVLHDDANELPAWFQETIGAYVSMLNECEYSFANHWANAKHLLGDKIRSDAIEHALTSRNPETAFAGSELAMLKYAEKLTLQAAAMIESDVNSLRQHGINDGQILEVNQLVSYFNYVNRLINGLGVTTDGDVVGYYAKSNDSLN